MVSLLGDGDVGCEVEYKVRRAVGGEEGGGGGWGGYDLVYLCAFLVFWFMVWRGEEIVLLLSEFSLRAVER